MGIWRWLKGTRGKVGAVAQIAYAERAIGLADPMRFVSVLEEHGLPQPDLVETFMLLAWTVAGLIVQQDDMRADRRSQEGFFLAYEHVMGKTLTERFGSDEHRARFREYTKSMPMFSAATAREPESMPQSEHEAAVIEIKQIIVPHLFPSLNLNDARASLVVTMYLAYSGHIATHLIENKGP